MEVLETEVGLQDKPDGQSRLMLKVVAESPTLLTPTVKVTELPLATLELDIVDETVRLAGERTVNPVCSVSDSGAAVPESVAATLAVISLE